MCVCVCVCADIIISYTVWVNMFDYLSAILSYILVAIPIFAGSYDNMDSVDLSSLISRVCVCIN